jgi:hypothetical protein
MSDDVYINSFGRKLQGEIGENIGMNAFRLYAWTEFTAAFAA